MGNMRQMGKGVPEPPPSRLRVLASIAIVSAPALRMLPWLAEIGLRGSGDQRSAFPTWKVPGNSWLRIESISTTTDFSISTFSEKGMNALLKPLMTR